MERTHTSLSAALRSRKALVVAPLIFLSLTAAGGLFLRPGSDDLAQHGVDAQSTIVRRQSVNGHEYAYVQFATTAGAMTTTRIHICHHQSYAVGKTLLVRYDPRNPLRAAEKDMLPASAGRLPTPVLLALLVGPVVALWRLRRIMRPVPEGEPRSDDLQPTEVEPERSEDEAEPAELVGADLTP